RWRRWPASWAAPGTRSTASLSRPTRTLLLTDTTRLDGVAAIGVDVHRWAHTRGVAGDGYVTVIVDLTSVVAGSGRAGLLDLVPGRSAAALSGWLAERDQAFRDRVEVVAMDGFGGYKNAATTALPDAVSGEAGEVHPAQLAVPSPTWPIYCRCTVGMS